jgi:hypothetical protein
MHKARFFLMPPSLSFNILHTLPDPASQLAANFFLLYCLVLADSKLYLWKQIFLFLLRDRVFYRLILEIFTVYTVQRIYVGQSVINICQVSMTVKIRLQKYSCTGTNGVYGTCWDFKIALVLIQQLIKRTTATLTVYLVLPPLLDKNVLRNLSV